MESKDCTLVLSTYDGGEDLWEGFFKALITQWPGFDLPVVMNTETKSYKFRGIDIKTINSGNKPKDTVWGRRLINVLNHIETEYILLFLEEISHSHGFSCGRMNEISFFLRHNPI